MRGIKCPSCGSRNIGKMENAQNGQGYICRDCRKEFGKAPLIKNKVI